MNNNNITIILISGYARSGKDTLAKALIEYARTKESARVSFATPLKRAVQLALNELGLGHVDAFTEDPKLKALLRPLFVEVGKAARAIDKDVFVKAAWKDICDLASGKELLVVPDLRYSNEIELFRKWGEGVGDTVKHIHISRSGNEAANQEEYESVKALPSPDAAAMFMDGATSDIAEWADKYMTQLWAKGIFKDKKLAVAYDEKASVWTDIKTEQSSDSPFVTVTASVAKFAGTLHGLDGKPITLTHGVSGTERFGADVIERRNELRAEDQKAMSEACKAFVRDNIPGVRIDELEKRWVRVTDKVGELMNKTQSLDEEFYSMDEIIDRVSQRVDHIDERITKIRDYAAGRTDRLMDKIRELEARIEKLEVARG